MSVSFYEASVPQCLSALASLSAILDKAVAEKGVDGADALLNAKIADDMLPTSFQVFLVCDLVHKFVARANGDEPPTLEPYQSITTVEEARKRVEAARQTLSSADRAKFESGLDAVVEFGMGPGKFAKLPVKGYFASYIVPNLYFHLCTAYAIFRANGVKLGKGDYLLPFGLDKVEVYTK